VPFSATGDKATGWVFADTAVARLVFFFNPV
jgi:hypothetical protein